MEPQTWMAAVFLDTKMQKTVFMFLKVYLDGPSQRGPSEVATIFRQFSECDGDEHLKSLYDLYIECQAAPHNEDRQKWRPAQGRDLSKYKPKLPQVGILIGHRTYWILVENILSNIGN